MGRERQRKRERRWRAKGVSLPHTHSDRDSSTRGGKRAKKGEREREKVEGGEGASLHGILAGPFASRLVERLTICLVLSPNLRNEGVIRVGVCQERANGQEDF